MVTGVTQGHRQYRYAIERIRLPIHFSSILYRLRDIVNYLSKVANFF